MPEAAPRHTVLLCPLAHEAKSIRRHLALPRYLMPSIIRTGPGATAVSKALERVAAEHADHSSLLVVLAGVAGGLAPVAAVPVIRAVVLEDATTHPVPFAPHEKDEPTVTLLGIDVPLASPGVKQEWNELTGASLVDTESHALVATCTRLGLTWSVVRGVSDAFDETLPIAVTHWVGANGATRPAQVAIDLIKRPSLVPEVWRLGKRSSACLQLVAARVATIIHAWHDQGLSRA